MSFLHTISGLLLVSLPLAAQEVAPPTGPDELRANVREWIETMRSIQSEENAWEKDQEVLKGYREGLEKEIEDLREQIARARVRKEGGDKESLDKIAERDRYIEAQNELAARVRQLEEGIVAQASLYPEGLLKQPKVAIGVESARTGLQLPQDRRGEDVSKRLFAATELLADVEKFQQGVHVHTELHKDSQGREFRMDVVYFGLSAAYAVNEDGSFAEIGHPEKDGWKFSEQASLAPAIKSLASSALSEKDATFTPLPFPKP
ncbi:MAG: hypothetical protein KF712_13760 [Akkermansiaceae bacterium]|nr:hypothetical protein [Akkermansiaceae bacterium]